MSLTRFLATAPTMKKSAQKHSPLAVKVRKNALESILVADYNIILRIVLLNLLEFLVEFPGEEEQKPGAQTTRPAKQQQAPLPSMRTRKSRKADRISEGSSEEESESEFEEEREIDSDNDAALYARRLEDLSEDDLDDGLEGVDEDGIDSDEEDEREQQLAMQLQ